jgi:predicted transglutaminase-like cysteine proteinase
MNWLILLIALQHVYPPSGLVDLCLRGEQVPNKFECQYAIDLVKKCLKEKDERCELIYKRWIKKIRTINTEENEWFKWDTDRGNTWTVGSRGDCEDLALKKELAMVRAGFPRELLGIGTGYTRLVTCPDRSRSPTGCHHAVLLVRMPNSILVMDESVSPTSDYQMSWDYFPKYLMLTDSPISKPSFN